MNELNTEYTTREAQPSTSTTDQKKLRNRLSQQAFRKRQTVYIQELKRQLHNAGKTDNERIAELEDENLRLRKRLLEFHNRAQSAQASLAALSESTARFLQIPGRNKPTHTSDESESPSPANPIVSTGSQDSLSIPCAALEQPSSKGQFLPMADTQIYSGANSLLFEDYCLQPQPNQPFTGINSFAPYDSMSESNPHAAVSSQETMSNVTSLLPLQPPDVVQYNFGVSYSPNQSYQLRPQEHNWTTFSNSSSPLAGLPGVWAHSYQMGPYAYQAAIHASPRNRRFQTTNSRFSDHILGIRNAVWSKLQRLQPILGTEVGRKQLHITMSVMLSLFNSIARPLALSWYAPTKFYFHIADLAIWQLNPTRETYMQLHSRYRPSALQLTESYPCVIDWCPFASVRDRMILSHSANPRLDDIICDMATAYVVESDVSELIRIDKHTMGYIRVWDLIQAMGIDEEENSLERLSGERACAPQADLPSMSHPENNIPTPASDILSLPAPTAHSLFEVKEYARLAFKALGMDRGICLFKLDSAFFIKYPELRDPDDDIVASGICVAPQTQTKIPGPTALDLDIWRSYNHLADWSLNLSPVLFRFIYVECKEWDLDEIKGF
ncbi:hypothetical protein VE02_01228 [Pseudogymnoascus sp. 03VT05]|nr:hypothetical protein VE02_01228 [Pseudogymnoascus sp. 03VT05]